MDRSSWWKIALVVGVVLSLVAFILGKILLVSESMRIKSIVFASSLQDGSVSVFLTGIHFNDSTGLPRNSMVYGPIVRNKQGSMERCVNVGQPQKLNYSTAVDPISSGRLKV